MEFFDKMKDKHHSNDMCTEFSVGQTAVQATILRDEDYNSVLSKDESKEMASQGQVNSVKEHSILHLREEDDISENMVHTSSKPTPPSSENAALPRCKCRVTYTQPFICGGCRKTFITICKLHEHLDQAHMESDMYFFDKITQTAFPRYGSSCKVTQTDPEMLCYEKHETKENEEANFDYEHENKRSCSNFADSTYVITEYVEDLYGSSYHGMIKKSKNLKAKHLSVGSINEHDLQSIGGSFETPVHTIDENKANVTVTSSYKSKRKRGKGEKKHFVKKKRNKTKNVSSCEFESRPCLKTEEIVKEQMEISFICKHCCLDFTSIHSYDQHMDEKHPKKKEVACNVCNQTFSSVTKLKQHSVSHESLGSHGCDSCAKTFNTSMGLDRHKAKLHPHPKNYVCTNCGKAYTTANMLQRHIKKCLNLKPYACPHDNCGKSYRCRHSLAIHMRNHTGERPFICEVCGKSFTRVNTLNKHTFVHTGDRPAKCDQCPKSFYNTGILYRHMMTHTEDKPHVCNECGKAFTNNWNLKAHQRQHTGEKPYCCDICGAGFTHNKSRKNHMKIHLEEVGSNIGDVLNSGHSSQSSVLAIGGDIHKAP